VITSNKVFVINNKEDLEKYIEGGGNMDKYDFPDIDFSAHSLLLLLGQNPDQLIISDIIGSLRKHAAHYVLHVEVKRYDVSDEYSKRWAYSLMTEKLNDETIIGIDVSYSKNESEYFYYYYDKKNFLSQRKDKISLKFHKDVGMEKFLTIVNSDASLRLGFTNRYFNLETYFGLHWYILETKNGSRIPSATIESFKEKEEIVSATYMFWGHNYTPFAIMDDFLLTLKPTTSYEQLLELAEQNNCTVSDDDMLQKKSFKLFVSKASNLDAMRMSNLFYETGLFEGVAPNFVSHMIR